MRATKPRKLFTWPALLVAAAVLSGFGCGIAIAEEAAAPNLLTGANMESVLPPGTSPFLASKQRPLLALALDEPRRVDAILGKLDGDDAAIGGDPDYWLDRAVALSASGKTIDATAALDTAAQLGSDREQIDYLRLLFALRVHSSDEKQLVGERCKAPPPGTLFAILCIHLHALSDPSSANLGSLLQSERRLSELWDPRRWDERYDPTRVAIFDLLRDRYGSVVDDRSADSLALNVVSSFFRGFHRTAMNKGGATPEGWQAFQTMLDAELARDQIDRADNWLKLYQVQILDRYRNPFEDFSALDNAVREERAVVLLRAGKAAEAEPLIAEITARITSAEPVTSRREKTFLIADRLDVTENPEPARRLFQGLWNDLAGLESTGPRRSDFTQRLGHATPYDNNTFDFERLAASGTSDPLAMRFASGLRLMALAARDGDLDQFDTLQQALGPISANLDSSVPAPMHRALLDLASAETIRLYSTKGKRLEEAEANVRRTLNLLDTRFNYPAGEPSALGIAFADVGRKVEKDERSFNTSMPVGERLRGRAQRLLARLLMARGAYDEAEPLLRDGHRAFLREYSIGGRLRDYRILTLDFARLALLRGDVPAMRDRASEALDSQNFQNPRSPGTAEALWGRATLLDATGDGYGAVLALERAIAIEAAAGLAEARTLARYRFAMAGILEKRGLGEVAIRFASPAFTTLREFPREDWDVTEQRGTETYLQALWRVQGTGADKTATNMAFLVGQYLSEGQAGRAVEAAARRAAISDPRLRDTLQAREEAERRRAVLALKFRDLFASGDGDGNRRARLALNAQIAQLDAIIKSSPAARSALRGTAPATMSLESVAGTLQDGESLISFVSAGDAIFAWGFSRRGASTKTRWRRLSVGRDAIERAVATIRCGVDITAWTQGARPSHCETLHAVRFEDLDPNQLPFRFDVASDLYQALFGPFSDMLDSNLLTIAPSGTLASLPMSTLLTRPPSVKLSSNDADFQAASWLGRERALRVIPFVANLSNQAPERRSSPVQATIIAFANPDLSGGAEADPRGDRCWKTPPRARGALSVPPEARNGLSDLQGLALPSVNFDLCNLEKLPGARLEIQAGTDASEGKFKALSASGRLSQTNTLIFATHALLPGPGDTVESKLEEPAIVLSLPRGPKTVQALEIDDGMLTSSEIAELKLGADWVVLSACNTGGGSDRASEPLSGLARAFFYAGAQSLLVSQWEINPYATERLVSGTFEAMRSDPSIGRSEALRRSMAALMIEGGQSTRPSDWAALEVIGADRRGIR